MIAYLIALTGAVDSSGRLHGFGGGVPLGPSLNGEPGAELTGASLDAANAEYAYYRALIYWLGNERLARKYGVPSEFPTLTAEEARVWSDVQGVWVAWITRLMAIVPPPPPPAKGGGQQELRVGSASAPQLPPVSPPTPEAVWAEKLFAGFTAEQRRALLAHIIKTPQS